MKDDPIFEYTLGRPLTLEDLTMEELEELEELSGAGFGKWTPTSERLLVQSVKHTVEHANRSGTWEYTSFFVICDGVELIEKWRLKEAKEHAEKAWEERHERI